MSKVSLAGNASGTGIFTIASPNSNTDRTLTLPDNTGTILTSASTGISASSITSGTLPKAQLPTGSILQVLTDTQPGEQATSSTSFTNTALSITITPTSATSKIFLLYTGSAGNDGAQESYLTFVRNSTNLGNSTTGLMRIWFNGSSSYHFSGMSMSFLDSPATTSATTYTVQFRTTSGIVYISGANATDSFTVFEVAA
jgi:hypothetical protein